LNFFQTKNHDLCRGLVVIVDFNLVHHIDSRWHQIILSVTTIHEKLVGLGFIQYGAVIHIFESDEKQKYV